MPKIVRITILFIPVFLFAQNVDMYLSLLHEGQTDGVKEYLPELISKYPIAYNVSNNREEVIKKSFISSYIFSFLNFKLNNLNIE